jgi:RimJ/RimL family protein N-acetyltransferase
MSAEPPAGPDFSRKPTLSGTLVTLVPAGADHVDRIYPLLADPETSRPTGSVHTSAASEQDLMRWSRQEIREIYIRWSTADDRIVWVIIENATGAVVGEVVLNDLNTDNLSCGFRIWIVGAQGRGLGTEATRLAVRHAFERQGLHRVELQVYAFNPRARHVYQKVGFRLEGTLRDALRFDDGWIDAHLMAMLSTDWRGSA